MAGVIIRYNRRTGDRVVKVYEGKHGYLDAFKDKAYRRDMTSADDDWEVALIGADSLETVKRTHSRYFSGKDRTEEWADRFA